MNHPDQEPREQDAREKDYWETHCRACESTLRPDGGCPYWYGGSHTLPYRDRLSRRG